MIDIPICIEAARLHDQVGLSFSEVQRALNLNSRGAAQRKIANGRKLNGAQTTPDGSPRAAFTPPVSQKVDRNTSSDFRTYTFTGSDETPYLIPVFNGEPHITGDCVVVGDVHLPTTDFNLARQMMSVAQKIGLRQLVIVGDLLNMDAYSQYDHIVPPIPVPVEIATAVQVVSQWAGWFEDILMVLGNHEHRLLRHNAGRFTADWLAHIINAGRGVLRMSPYSHVIIHSGGEVWRATHQRGYSQMPLRVGRELAIKHEMNVITLHQHHAAKGRDKFNRYTVIDGGGLFDDDKMAYVKLTDSTAPVMARGFTVLVNGAGHLITPYKSFTDLDVLLAGLAVQRARAA